MLRNLVIVAVVTQAVLAGTKTTVTPLDTTLDIWTVSGDKSSLKMYGIPKMAIFCAPAAAGSDLMLESESLTFSEEGESEVRISIAYKISSDCTDLGVAECGMFNVSAGSIKRKINVLSEGMEGTTKVSFIVPDKEGTVSISFPYRACITISNVQVVLSTCNQGKGRKQIQTDKSETLTCPCAAGHFSETADSCEPCPTNTFRSVINRFTDCLACPLNSGTSHRGSVKCDCNMKYFKLGEEQFCTGVPGAVSNLKTEIVTAAEHSAVVSWSWPLDNGDRPNSEITFKVECLSDCENVLIQQNSTNATRVLVTCEDNESLKDKKVTLKITALNKLSLTQDEKTSVEYQLFTAPETFRRKKSGSSTEIYVMIACLIAAFLVVAFLVGYKLSIYLRRRVSEKPKGGSGSSESPISAPSPDSIQVMELDKSEGEKLLNGDAIA